MIRRVFWLTVGAAGGIMGYRRVAALGQRLPGRSATRRQRLSLGATIGATRAVRGFSRDVRAGMELYSARRSPAVGPTLPAVPPDLTVKDDPDAVG